MAGRQATLPDFGLFGHIPLATAAPVYLHRNDPPPTEPTYIAHIPPAEPRAAPEPTPPPGEQVTFDAIDSPPAAPPTPKWEPHRDHATPKACDRCGEHVSPRFKQIWADDWGYLDGCPACLPRSVRFGQDDIYGRDKDDAQAEFTAPVNR